MKHDDKFAVVTYSDNFQLCSNATEALAEYEEASTDSSPEIWTVEEQKFQLIDADDFAETHLELSGDGGYTTPDAVVDALESFNKVLSETPSGYYSCVKQLNIDDIKNLIEEHKATAASSASKLESN